MPAITIAFRTRLWLVLALTTINSGLYMLVNAWPHGTPIMLPLNVIDRMLGWHAWTIWPYWALLLIGPLLALGLRERDVLLATARAYGVALTLNVTLWLSWPTHIVQRTLPSDLDALTTGAWHLLYTLDGPNNCFPSGHVTIPLVAASGCACSTHARTDGCGHFCLACCQASSPQDSITAGTFLAEWRRPLAGYSLQVHGVFAASANGPVIFVALTFRLCKPNVISPLSPMTSNAWPTCPVRSMPTCG